MALQWGVVEALSYAPREGWVSCRKKGMMVTSRRQPAEGPAGEPAGVVEMVKGGRVKGEG